MSASILSHIHRLVQGFFLIFSFQILLAFLLMLHSHTLVATGRIRVLYSLRLSFLCASCDFMMGNSEKYILFADIILLCIYTSS
jgi:hypothetical protein